MRRVILSLILLVIVAIAVIAATAMRPNTPTQAESADFAAEDCGVISLDELAENPREALIQEAVAQQFNHALNPAIAMGLNDTGLQVTPAVSRCIMPDTSS